MKRIIFAIHGIRSSEQGNWVNDFTNFIKKDTRFEDDIPVAHTYGFLFATKSAIPGVMYHRVKKLMEVLRNLTKKHPEAELNIVAHSYGTLLSFEAIKRSGEDGKALIMVDKMILVSSVVSRHREIPYDDTVRPGKIKQLHCYCSFADEVCKFNPFGHSGCYGFAKNKYDSKCYPKPFEELEIHNHQVGILEHGDYFNGDKYYKEWADIICGS